MKITKMALGKSVLVAMFLMMTSAYSINVQAGVCEAEFNDWERRYNDLLNNHDLARSVNAKSDDIREAREIYQASLLSGELPKASYYYDGDKDINASISRFELDIYNQVNTKDDTWAGRNHVNLEYGKQSLAQNYYIVCMLKAQRDGLLKSTKQAKNSKTKNTAAESKQSQSANANSQDATDNDASSNNKPLTKAELKAQKAEQQAQQDEQQAQQATQVSQDHQTKANQKRQGKRRRHEPENEAHNCIKPDFGGLYGGMENTCNYKVWYTYCGYHPTENSWLRGMACEKQSFGSGLVSPGRQDAAHTHGVEKLYWFACKDPAWPVDVEFVDGDNIKGRCHTVGGGSD